MVAGLRPQISETCYAKHYDTGVASLHLEATHANSQNGKRYLGTFIPRSPFCFQSVFVLLLSPTRATYTSQHPTDILRGSARCSNFLQPDVTYSSQNPVPKHRHFAVYFPSCKRPGFAFTKATDTITVFRFHSLRHSSRDSVVSIPVILRCPAFLQFLQRNIRV
jgi:hypothetical protein